MAEYRRAKADGSDVMIRDGWLYQPGDAVPDHTHNFEHWTRCTHGHIRVGLLMPDGSDIGSELRPASDPILVPAEAMHSITAIEPDSRYECEYLHRGPDGQPSDEYLGYMPAYV